MKTLKKIIINKNNMKITDTIRFILSLILLIIIWNNSHWSVSLSLSFLLINNEGIYFLLKQNNMI